MHKPKRLVDMLALLLALAMLLSVLLIALEAHHDCCGEDCAICALLHSCEELLKNLLPIAVLLWAVRRLCISLFAAGYDGPRPTAPHTLIALKVKLSN